MVEGGEVDCSGAGEDEKKEPDSDAGPTSSSAATATAAVADETVLATDLGNTAENEDEVIVTEGGEEGDEDFEIIPPLYVQARSLFVNSDVLNADDIELKWNEPDEDALRAFLVERMGFSVDRVNSGIKRLKEANQQKSQKRMDR